MKNPPLFEENQGLPEYEQIKITEFALLRKWQKQLLIKGYEATIKYLYELVEFCECLENTKKIYTDQGDSTHPNKKHKSVSYKTPKIQAG